VPVVALEAAPMQTRFGRKSKPTFKIVGWKAADGECGKSGNYHRSRVRKRWTTASRGDDQACASPATRRLSLATPNNQEAAMADKPRAGNGVPPDAQDFDRCGSMRGWATALPM
jgi:hypothetical protein